MKLFVKGLPKDGHYLSWYCKMLAHLFEMILYHEVKNYTDTKINSIAASSFTGKLLTKLPSIN